MNEKTIERYQLVSAKLKTLAAKLLVDLGDETRILERAKHKPRVLIVGEFNTGKSSLVNSALGEVLLPTGVTPTTSLTTVMERGPFQVKVKPLGQKDSMNFEPGKTSKMGYGIKEEVFEWSNFRALLTDQKNIDQIEQIYIFHPAVPDSMLIIDTPGINDLAKSRAEIVYGFIPTADIVVFVISASKPFSESERTFLEERILASDLKKIVFVVNRIDEVEPAERAELLKDIADQVKASVNKAYANLNKIIGQNLYQNVEQLTVMPASSKQMAPIEGGSASKGIGFATPTTKSESNFAEMNRTIWNHLQTASGKDRQNEVEQLLHYSLRRSSMRIRRAIDSTNLVRTSGNDVMIKRLQENSDRLKKLKDIFRSSEKKIQSAEKELKDRIHAQIEKTITEMTQTGIWNRDPGTINQRLKELYEYITNTMKTRLDDLYAELGQDFDAVLEDRRYMEAHEFSIQYDLSDLPNKIISSLSFAYLAAIFFGINVGLFAGAAYMASQVVANKRSIKEFLLNARVKEDKILEVKKELLMTVDQEIEYAIDFVRQSLSQRADLIQGDVRNLVYALHRAPNLDLVSLQAELDGIQPEVNGFIAARDPDPAKT